MSNNDKSSGGDGKGPKIDWGAQVKNTLISIVAVVVVLMLMRYAGFRN